MKALVTGSTGFLGARLCEMLLEAGYQVRALHRPTSSLTLLEGVGVEKCVGDITQPSTLPEALLGVEVVFHVAAKAAYWRDTKSIYTVNVEGTRNLLTAAMEASVNRVVFTSSVSALGVPDPIQRAPLMDETHVWNYKPKWWQYGHSKHLAEREVQWAVARGVDVVIVNPTTIMGPGDKNRISGEIIIEMAERPLPGSLPGGMNVIHRDDAVRGHLLALERGKTGERYILGDENISHRKLTHLVADVLDVAPPARELPTQLLRALATPVDIARRLGINTPINGELLRLAGYFFHYDTNTAQEVLGFQAKSDPRTAVEETYTWYRQHGYIA